MSVKFSLENKLRASFSSFSPFSEVQQVMSVNIGTTIEAVREIKSAALSEAGDSK